MSPAEFSSFLLKECSFLPASHRRELLEFAFLQSQEDLIESWNKPIPQQKLPRLESVLEKLEKKMPVAYITGSIPFCGCKIFVDPHVLIPRPETESLVEMIAPHFFEKKMSVVDICTGSGCIAIALKKKNPLLDVTATDISLQALALAKKNALENEVEVAFFQGDLDLALPKKKFSAVVCNPPYISEEEYGELDPSVRFFEPKKALVGEDCGLEFYKRLEACLPLFLEPQAKVFLEMGERQGEALRQIFSTPWWSKREVVRDFCGKERFFFLEFE